MIVTVDDVKFIFKVNNIKLDLTDEEIEKLIRLELNSLLGELGISLEPQIREYITYHRHPFKPIVLPLNNVIGIDSVYVNHRKLPPHMYFLDTIEGIVEIHPKYHHPHWHTHPLHHHHIHEVKINYITQISPFILEKLKPLLLDTILYNNIPDTTSDDMWVKSITEGDVTVSYGRETNLLARLGKSIQSQKDNILKHLQKNNVMMI